MKITNLPIDAIRPDPNQPRQTLDHEYITDLSNSIRTEGIINPIEVDQDSVIITGEMRWRAAKIAGLTEVPCKIISAKEINRFRRQVIENIHHNTMTDWDTAVALQKLLDGRVAASQRDLARVIGKSRGYVEDRFQILRSSQPLQKALQANKITSNYIRAVSRTPEAYRAKMEEKVLSGEFKGSEIAIEVASAMKRAPEQAEEIINKDYSKYSSIRSLSVDINKIAAPNSELIRKSFDPSEELSKIKDSLIQWLDKNQKTKVGKLHAPRILLTLSVMQEAINDWVSK
jgi:ParB family chromosome partitioning protein